MTGRFDRAKRLANTQLKTHTIGLAGTALLIIAIVSADGLIAVPADKIRVGGQTMTMDQSNRLIQQSQTPDKRDDEYHVNQERITARVTKLKTWVNQSDDLQTIQSTVYALGKQHGIKPISFDEGDTETIGAINFRALRCKGRAEYEDICRFLAALARGERPIHCTRVSLQQLPSIASSSSSPAPSAICSMEFDLRIPHTANLSDLDQLLFPVARSQPPVASPQLNVPAPSPASDLP